MKTINARVKNRIGTNAAWLADNPVILNGEIALVKDGTLVRFKIGDGSATYSALPFNVFEPTYTKGLALAATNPGTPVTGDFWNVTPGTTLANFLDNTSTAITIPTTVTGQSVVDAKVIFDGAHWVPTYSLITIPTAKILPWTAAAYISGDEVVFLGRIWRANAAIISSDIPGLSNKWVDILKPIDSITFINGKNLFDKTKIVANSFINWGTGNVQGGYPAGAASDFIPVVPGSTYSYNSAIDYKAYYDENKTFVSGDSATASPTTIPAGCYYIRYTAAMASLDTQQFEIGSVTTSYEDFKQYVINANGDKIKISNELYPVILRDSKNLFNKNDVTLNSFINYTNGNVQGSYPAGAASNFIPVISGETYTYNSPIDYYAFYDASKVFISGDSIPGSKVIPAGAYFMRYTAQAASLDTMQLEHGSTTTGYEPYGKLSIYPYSDGGRVPLKWTTEGDSITYRNHYQPIVKGVFNLNIVNVAVSGTTLSDTSSGAHDGMCDNSRFNNIPTDSDIVSILAGTNDWNASIALGADTSTNTTEFNGALNTWLGKVSTAIPLARVFLCTTTYGEYPSHTSDGHAWPNGWTNSLGLTTLDYAEAIRKAGKRWGVPVVDLNNDCGWNHNNLATYVDFDGAYLHPGANGTNRMAQVFIKKFTNLI